MALFHLSVTQTKRSAGQSAIASAAYRAWERLYSEYYGEYSDYTRKGGYPIDFVMPKPAQHRPQSFACPCTARPTTEQFNIFAKAGISANRLPR